jgi:hypothetical protein
MRIVIGLCALAVASCHTGSSNTIAGAAVMTSLALGASAANRAAGGCYAVCQEGEACNESTGLCEVLRCRGKCRADESCEEGFFGIKCIPGPALSVSTGASPVTVRPPASEKEKEKEKDQGKEKDSRPAVPDAAKP